MVLINSIILKCLIHFNDLCCEDKYTAVLFQNNGNKDFPPSLSYGFAVEDIFCLDYFLLSKVKEGKTYVEKKSKM